MSNLIIDDKYCSDQIFLKGFMVSALKYVSKKLPAVKTCVFMAPGPETAPLVMCVKKLEEQKLIHPLSYEKQQELGIVINFVKENSNKPIANSIDNPARFYTPMSHSKGPDLESTNDTLKSNTYSI